jgi:hypothetical protein
MATETLRTDRVRNDEEAREGPPTLSIGYHVVRRHLGSKLVQGTDQNLTFVMLRPNHHRTPDLVRRNIRSRGLGV